MLKMRLQRIGRKNNPTYRVLVVDSRQGPKSGKFVDQIGSFDPKVGTPQIDTEKAKKWIAEGVQTSGRVHNMLVDLKVIDAKKVNVLPKKTPIVKEEESAEEAAPEAAEAAEGDAPAEETEAQAEETTEEAPAEEEKAKVTEGDSPEASEEDASKKEEAPAAA